MFAPWACADPGAGRGWVYLFLFLLLLLFFFFFFFFFSDYILGVVSSDISSNKISSPSRLVSSSIDCWMGDEHDYSLTNSLIDYTSLSEPLQNVPHHLVDAKTLCGVGCRDAMFSCMHVPLQNRLEIIVPAGWAFKH